MRSLTPLAFILGLFLTQTARLHAQPLSSADKAKIDKVLALDEENGPGYAVALYRNGKVVYAMGFGMADIEHKVPITSQTRFDIGSTSKQFTAASLVLLAQDGKLSLDDPIRKYLPEMPSYGDSITIRHMLNHTSGLRDYLGLMAMAGYDIDDVTTAEDALRIIARQTGLDFPIGTEHAYSNTGYFLASIIVQRVSGKTLRQFAQERIFNPLGMTSTSYVDDHTLILPNRAVGYTNGEDDEYHRAVSNWEQNGDGGVFTTVEDLVRWDENFYSPKVGGAGLPAELQHWGRLKNGDTLDYAEGLMRGTMGTFKVVLHGGAWGGYRAQLLRIPSEHVSVAVLANLDRTSPDEIARKVLGVIYGEEAVKRRAPKTADVQPVVFKPEQFDSYSGEFEMDDSPDFKVTFTREGDHYYTQATGQRRVEMIPLSDSTFRLKDLPATIIFHRSSDGPVNTITLEQGGSYTAQRVGSVKETPRPLTAYVGTYYSRELDSRFTLAIEEGKLVAHHARLATATLTQGHNDRFGADQWYLGQLQFEVDPSGTATAMLVTAGRSQKMRFDRVKE